MNARRIKKLRITADGLLRLLRSLDGNQLLGCTGLPADVRAVAVNPRLGVRNVSN